MNKKGQGLPLNTLVIAIIVIVVLIIVILFFVGGMSGITDKIKNIFTSQTIGTDRALAVQTCNQYCRNAELLPTDNDRKNSPFCKHSFTIDDNGDGIADIVEGERIDWFCEEDLGVSCSFTCPKKGETTEQK